MFSAISFQAAAAPKPPPRPARTLRDMGAYMSPMDQNVVIIPPDKPVNRKPISSSRAATYMLGGTIAGSLAGTYAVLFLATALPGGASALAAAGLMVGGAALGGVLGYCAGK